MITITSTITSLVKDKDKYLAYILFKDDMGTVLSKTSCYYDPIDTTLFEQTIQNKIDALVVHTDEIDTIKTSAETVLQSVMTTKVAEMKSKTLEIK
jgi:hypothetical protein